MATETVTLDCARIGKPDIGLVGRIARGRLAARRLGYELRIRNASPELVELIALAGLDRVLRVEVQRQPE